MRYVDADKLLKGFQHRANEHEEMMARHIPGENNQWSVAINAVKTAKTEDAAPVIHAHWEKVHGFSTPGNAAYVECSKCHDFISGHLEGVETFHWGYCPHCGARMDEVTE